jgi:hypothetical protein
MDVQTQNARGASCKNSNLDHYVYERAKATKSARKFKHHLDSHLLARKRSGPGSCLIRHKEETDESAVEPEWAAWRRQERITKVLRTRTNNHVRVTRY